MHFEYLIRVGLHESTGQYYKPFLHSSSVCSLVDTCYRPFSHCIDQAGLGAFTAKSGRKHYNPPPLTVM